MSYEFNNFSYVMDNVANAFQRIRIVNMKTDQELSEFLDSDFRYVLPKYSVDITDTRCSINLHVKNVDENNFQSLLNVESKSAHVKFSAPGPKLTDINYAFYVKLSNDMNVKNARVTRCDLFGEVEILFGISREHRLTSYFVGKSPKLLKQILVREHQYGDVVLNNNPVRDDNYYYNYRIKDSDTDSNTDADSISEDTKIANGVIPYKNYEDYLFERNHELEITYGYKSFNDGRRNSRIY